MTKDILIKVCGMSQANNIKAVAKLPIDYMGFIFCPSSKRYVGTKTSLSELLPDTANSTTSHLATADNMPHINKVGVFVDSTTQDIITRVVNYSLDAIQLHGTESPTFIRNLRATLIPDIRRKLEIFKAISIANTDDFKKCAEYEETVDMFVFDTKCQSHGGSGQQFDWTLLDAYNGNTPFLLSGGISVDDANRINNIRHEMFAGVDINSRFETEPGVKDVELLKSFIKQLI